ncbi:hypothetical protein HD553DRAFT_326780 [Filobasidium floriforme]|uniref:uncharacterized protein n=1 Tax=Filobasidium floriforme TaxID=5210 RepID=UPI001E8E47D5|nr:uncharacterized protein HD553DRAFT_326780 [Filobasidium floriforme]KAH8078587.1 hypothetical protein HD553DRAFT_326780 [Filobasidium floriforme]
MTSLVGKTALVTGGSAGIGAAVAKQLASRGVRVAINYSSNRERAAKTLSQLEGSGHILVQGNAFDREGIEQLTTLETMKDLDIIISNAGWTAFGEFNDLGAVSDDDWMKCYQSNVMSHLWLSQACRETLERTKGCIVISASVAGIKPSGSSMLCLVKPVSKAATIHLAKSLAKACAPNIRVNSVSAGVMMTDWSKGFDEEHIEKVIQSNSLRKLVNVEEAAMLYVALAENGSMTGQNLELVASY